MSARAACSAATLLVLAGCTDPAAHVPPFARQPYQAFSREAAVAIALTEWRAFGAPVDDDPPGARPPQPGELKLERLEGLWQRVGEYWWLGLNAGEPETGWTGKHDATGRPFAADDDERYAWSAAFVSYVMRMAGAGARFPYAAAHHTYIDAAYWQTRDGGARWAITAERPESYAPLPGDIVCFSRTPQPLRYDDLPDERFAAHCDIVTHTAPGEMEVVGGNVDDAVTLKHVPLTADGRLAALDRPVLDTRYPWFVVLRVTYDTVLQAHAAAPHPAVRD